MRADLYLLDTNVVVRFVLGEPAAQALLARRLFMAAERGELRLELPAVIVAQCVYVLESLYEAERPEIAEALRRVMGLSGVEVTEMDVLATALDQFGRTSLDFADAYLAAVANARDVGVASFDRDFKKMRTVRTFDWSSLAE